MRIDLKNYDKETEFKEIIDEYIFPLLGMKGDNIQKIPDKDSFFKNTHNEIIFFEKQKIYFLPYKNSKWGYFIDTVKCMNNFNFTLCRKVLAKLVSVANNNLKIGTQKNFKYINEQQCISSYEVAVQTSICEYLTNNNSADKNDTMKTLLNLLDKLQKWALKTYEGKKVPFGFVIDMKEISKTKLNYLEFLGDEFSATISDGISSVVVIDKYGNYLDYKSIVENNKIKACQLNNCLPIRFAQIINENVSENSLRIGVFLLTGGDIFIAKNGKIDLIKRNGRWANFSYQSFLNVMERYNNTEDIDKQILMEVFSSAIDVSLSHCGGIIAIVKDGMELKNSEMESKDAEKENILSECDNLLVSKNDDELKDALSKKENEYNINKRLYKRNMIKNLLNGKKLFINIDRKLRAELIGLDGATIIQKDGSVVAFGAIIQNEKGSTGGGRGAAAKLLSRYGGFAIKISTDGYIEVFMNRELKYYIK